MAVAWPLVSTFHTQFWNKSHQWNLPNHTPPVHSRSWNCQVFPSWRDHFTVRLTWQFGLSFCPISKCYSALKVKLVILHYTRMADNNNITMSVFACLCMSCCPICVFLPHLSVCVVLPISVFVAVFLSSSLSQCFSAEHLTLSQCLSAPSVCLHLSPTFLHLSVPSQSFYSCLCIKLCPSLSLVRLSTLRKFPLLF